MNDDDRQPARGPRGPLLGGAYAVLVGSAAAAAAFGASGGTMAALLAGAGTAALAMLLAQFVTSGRFEWISGRIGLDVTMGFHRIAGLAVLGFAAAHVLLLPLRQPAGSALAYPRRLLNAFVAPGNLTGVAALALLLGLVVWARWYRGRGISYPRWRLLHGAGALLAVLLGAVHLLQRGGGSASVLPVAILGLLAVVAVGSLAVVWVFRARQAYGLGFTVGDVRRLADGVVALTLRAPAGSRFAFRAGQFAWLAFAGRHTVTDNPFSIASAPEDLPDLRFLVREAGDATRRFIDLAPGTAVAVDGPHGSFVDDRPADAIVMIAGGIGIAPVLSLLRSAAARGDRRPYRLVYGARRAADLVAGEAIAGLAGRLDLSVDLMVEDGPLPAGARAGRMTQEATRTLVAGLDCRRVLVFVCGPPGMMDAAVTMLVGCGVPAERIVMERFDYDGADDPVSRGLRRRFVAILAAAAVATIGAAIMR